MRRTINKNHIVSLYTVSECLYVDWQGHREFVKNNEKGEEIIYLLPRLWRPKYYKDTYYRRLFSIEDDLYTLEEMNNYILANYKEFFDGGVLTWKHGQIYRNPYVFIKLSNGDYYKIYKSTEEECEEYINNMQKEYNFLIDIEI